MAAYSLKERKTFSSLYIKKAELLNSPLGGKIKAVLDATPDLRWYHRSAEEQSRPANCSTLTGKDKMGKTINLCSEKNSVYTSRFFLSH